jgi:uncharacterized protein YcbK (DUF882 family)
MIRSTRSDIQQVNCQLRNWLLLLEIEKNSATASQIDLVCTYRLRIQRQMLQQVSMKVLEKQC